MSEDPRRAPLSHRERGIIDYVLKLTAEPWNVTAGDVERLRQCGLGDAGVLDVCQVAGYYAFVNRLAQGLGVELEE
jgi:alkylhydroperoxidase family enzyme